MIFGPFLPFFGSFWHRLGPRHYLNPSHLLCSSFHISPQVFPYKRSNRRRSSFFGTRQWNTLQLRSCLHNRANFLLTTHYLPQSICLTNEHFLCRMPRHKCIFQNDVIFIEFFSLDFLYCIIPYRTGSDIQVYRIVSPLDEIVQYRYRYRGLSIHSVSQELTYE